VSGAITRMMSEDHDRLDALLARVVRDDGSFDLDVYGELRAGLARHIGMEEKILFPAARRHSTHELEPSLAKLRADHARLGWLIVWTPTREIIDEIRTILEAHNRLEEDVVYAACERVIDGEADDVLAAMRAAPAVPMRPLQAPRPPRP